MIVAESTLLTAREAAQFLRMSERKLWDLTDCGDIRVVRSGRYVRYDRQDLEAWLDRQKSGGVRATQEVKA